MRFVKLLREGRGVWGVLHGDVVRTLTEPPFEGVRYDGESRPLRVSVMTERACPCPAAASWLPVRPQKLSALERTISTTSMK